MRTILMWVAATGTAILGCGDSTSGECAEGTYLLDGRCYAVDPNDTTPPAVTVDPPLRTRTVGDVRLVSDEPAVIYYTTDGSVPTRLSPSEPSNVLIPDVPDDGVVQYFAVDLAGNATPVTRLAWDVDATPPGPPRGLTVGLTGTTRALSWVNPIAAPDFAGTIVARVEGAAAAPEPGVHYAVGDEIAPGVTVVSVGPLNAGAAGAFAETRPTSPGMVRYLAWSYDDLHNYSATASAHALVEIPAQSAAISIDAAAGTVSIPTPPSTLGLTGTAALAGSTLTVTMAIENRTNRALFAPKVVLADLAGTGGAWSDEDGEIDNVPYRAYGAAIAPGATLTRTFTFTGVGATDVITATAQLRFDRVIGVGFWENTAGAILDEGTGQQIVALPSAGAEATGPGGNQSMRAGGITPDGLIVYGARNASRVSVFDLATATLVGGVTLSPYKSAAAQVVLAAGGGTGYAIEMTGHVYSGRRGGALAHLVQFDVLTLTETQRIPLGSVRGRADLRISPDGRHLAIATGLDQVLIVDLDTLTVARRIPELAPAIAWSPDGSRLALASPTAVRFYDTLTWTLASEIEAPVGGGKMHRMAYAGTSQLWLGRANSVVAVDLAAGTSQSFNFQGDLLDVYDGKVHAGGDSSVRRLDAAGEQEVRWSLSATAYGHAMVRSPF